MFAVNLSPSHQPVKDYYSQLNQYEKVGARHEGAVRTAHGAGQLGWTLVPEWSPQTKRIRI